MNVMASRTLLVNPDDQQKRAYGFALEALDVCIKNLIIGEPVKKAYISARDFLRGKDAGLASKLHTNFGFGIGQGIKEDILLINESNETLVTPWMTFHVRITLTDIHSKLSRGVIAIGETIVTNEDGTQQVLTSGIQRKYSEISYSLSNEEEEEQKDTKMKNDGADAEDGASSEDSRNMGRSVNPNNITDKRLRQKNFMQH